MLLVNAHRRLNKPQPFADHRAVKTQFDLHKTPSVLIVAEDFPAFDTTTHDRV